MIRTVIDVKSILFRNGLELWILNHSEKEKELQTQIEWFVNVYLIIPKTV